MTTTTHHISLHHLYLLAPGGTVEEIQRFYGGALGLTESVKPPSLDDVPVLWFSAGPLVLHVGHPETGIVGGSHTALAVDSVDAVRARMIEQGYAVDDNVIAMGYPRFYIRDPWGNQFEILPAALPQT